MAKEIERKFLVCGELKHLLSSKVVSLRDIFVVTLRVQYELEFAVIKVI